MSGTQADGTTLAQVRYINAEWRDQAEPPRIGSRESRRANTSFQDVTVHNARPRLTAGEIALERNGFTLTRNSSEVADFRDTDEVAATYYGEMTALIRELTGADRVFVRGHLVRTETPTDFNDGYARFVHCDYNAARQEEMRDELLARDGVIAQEDWTCVWYNTWQPFDHPVENNPLAMIDWQSLPLEDVIGYLYTGRGRDSLVAAPVYNPEHQFCYFPMMSTDEVLVTTQIDQRSGHALYCPHTSFDLPVGMRGALPRRSVETRLLAVFENDS
jgi:hypothetical protein